MGLLCVPCYVEHHVDNKTAMAMSLARLILSMHTCLGALSTSVADRKAPPGPYIIEVHGSLWIGTASDVGPQLLFLCVLFSVF